MKIRRPLLTSILMVMILFGSVASAYALVHSTSWYNARAYNWHNIGSADPDYNCLAYALGITNDWVWPWGSADPTNAQANSYMSSLGYDNCSYGYPINNPLIISYGTSSDICHFGKVDGYESKAKWGGCELMRHDNLYPYKSSPGYGDPYTTYY